MKNNNKRVRLNENTLRKMIRESLKNVIREQDELDDDPSVWGGIDDYPENETSAEQWRKLQNAQFGDPRPEQWRKDWREFSRDPKWMFSEPGKDADYRLGHEDENGFQRNGKGEYGMDALDPNIKYARDTRMFNGWRIDGNPSDVNHSPEDEELPQEYLDSLNESISRAIKKVIGRK